MYLGSITPSKINVTLIPLYERVSVYPIKNFISVICKLQWCDMMIIWI